MFPVDNEPLKKEWGPSIESLHLCFILLVTRIALSFAIIIYGAPEESRAHIADLLGRNIPAEPRQYKRLCEPQELGPHAMSIRPHHGQLQDACRRCIVEHPCVIHHSV